MKTPKNKYPIIAAAALGLAGLIPASFGGEKEPSPQNAAVSSAKQDPVEIHLNEIVVNPLNLMEVRQSQFSRRKPVQSVSYYLVENAESTVEGERRFVVMKKTVPFLKDATAKTEEFLKLRYLENGNKTVVALKDSWVTPDEHPILKLLPKPEPQKKITP